MGSYEEASRMLDLAAQALTPGLIGQFIEQLRTAKGYLSSAGDIYASQWGGTLQMAESELQVIMAQMGPVIARFEEEAARLKAAPS